MTDNHPINPPPEIVDKIRNETLHSMFTNTVTREVQLIVAAYRSGADHELEACCEWVRNTNFIDLDGHDALRTSRRPKPPSLKAQARLQLDRLIALIPTEGALAMAEPIRLALEALDD